jgi:phosphoserine phosphatase
MAVKCVPMGSIRLVVFDLDGTLTRGDTVCCVIARKLGHFERMLELERIITDDAGSRRDRAGDPSPVMARS